MVLFFLKTTAYLILLFIGVCLYTKMKMPKKKHQFYPVTFTPVEKCSPQFTLRSCFGNVGGSRGIRRKPTQVLTGS